MWDKLRFLAEWLGVFLRGGEHQSPSACGNTFNFHRSIRRHCLRCSKQPHTSAGIISGDRKTHRCHSPLCAQFLDTPSPPSILYGRAKPNQAPLTSLKCPATERLQLQVDITTVWEPCCKLVGTGAMKFRHVQYIYITDNVCTNHTT